MKTTDLIPLILLELNESDKYGFELTKSVETKTNGKIIIKQPTLYTILKKLEKSKFITSFWQDSDIGGKRHYYKLTENGRLQVSTLPSFDVLVEHMLLDDENLTKNESPSLYNIINEAKQSNSFTNSTDDNEITPISSSFSAEKENKNLFDLNEENTYTISTLESNDLKNYDNLNSTQVSFDFDSQLKSDVIQNKAEESTSNINEKTVKTDDDFKSFSIMDIIANEKKSDSKNETPAEIDNSPTQIESIIESDELFKENSIDNLTEIEINNNNSQILKNDATIKEENFAGSKEVQKFTEKESTQLTEEYKEKLKSIYSANQKTTKIPRPNEEYSTDKVKYVDYINIDSKEEYKTAKLVAKNMIYRSLSSAGVLLLLIALTSIVTSFTGSSSLFTIFALVGACLVIFYPTLVALNHDRIKLDYEENKFSIDIKKQAIFCFVVELLILLLCIIVNIAIGNNTLAKMLTISNFENFYAPLLLGLCVFADLYFTYLFFFKRNNLSKNK